MDNLTGTLLGFAHVIAASFVTLHVLFAHREVRSSIGWIALAWLSPFIGSSIYLAFGVNRIARRARRLGPPGAGSALEHRTRAPEVLSRAPTSGIMSIALAGDAITGLELTKGNSLELFRDGDAAYPAMLDAIDNAQQSIALASYIFASDSTGNKFADALIAASERGVAVRVLADGIGSGYFRAPVLARLHEGGVKVGRFLHDWAPWAMTFINLRNHKKMLIVDGKTAFTGGMNISDKNVSGENHCPKVRDVQARIEGPIVKQLMQSFSADWSFTTGEELAGEVWWPKIENSGTEPSGDIPMRGVASGPDESLGRIEAMLATAVEQATKRIRIVTPYFLPEDRLFEVVRRAALRGVIVEILVPEKTNHFYFNWAITAHLTTFPLDGIDCYLSPEPFDHTKLMSVDGYWCNFGSANWDARSMRLNFEYQVECYGLEATGAVDAIIDAKIAKAKKLTAAMLAGRPTLIKLRDASARLLLPYL